MHVGTQLDWLYSNCQAFVFSYRSTVCTMLPCFLYMEAYKAAHHRETVQSILLRIRKRSQMAACQIDLVLSRCLVPMENCKLTKYPAGLRDFDDACAPSNQTLKCVQVNFQCHLCPPASNTLDVR